jgi:hypothetical protein
MALQPACGSVPERRIGSQTVDVYYEAQTSVRTRRVACECKDYDRPLTKSIIQREARSHSRHHLSTAGRRDSTGCAHARRCAGLLNLNPLALISSVPTLIGTTHLSN